MSSTSGENHRGIRLSNTIHSDVAPCLPLPSLPVFCGALENELHLFDEPRSQNGTEALAQAGKIAELLQATDVSYLDLHENPTPAKNKSKNYLQLYDEVLRTNPQAFECSATGPLKESVRAAGVSTISAPQHVEQNLSLIDEATPHRNGARHQLADNKLEALPSSSMKIKLKKKKGDDDVSTSSGTVPSERQDAIIKGFCEQLEEFCGKAEVPADDRDEEELLLLPISDVRKLVNEIMSIRTKKILHLVPVDFLVRLLKILDNQIHGAEGLSFTDCEHSDSNLMPTILCALESIHAALALMAHNDMPKPLYKEEIIERILEFCRRQIMDVISAHDPSYVVNKQFEDGVLYGEEDDVYDPESSVTKKRRSNKSRAKKSTNKISAAGNSVMQKLCTILGFLKDLLIIERLSYSCILQLVRTCFTTFLVDNIKLMQLKSISLISGIFSSYAQHRGYIIDEVLQVLCKLPSSKRVLRTYHLPDEEQMQIQMVTALLIQLVQCSAKFPDLSASATVGKTIMEYHFDTDYMGKFHEAVTETCCLFWSRILQRFSSVKSQDASEVKMMVDNLVIDLLATLHLPEYPASATILEVLCVLLLQNAGLKSKDTSSRLMAIDILGTIAARLKHDTVLYRNDKFWITGVLDGKSAGHGYPKDRCSICLVELNESSLFTCQECKRLFHSDCMGVCDYDIPARGCYCPLCQCHKQLLALQSYCKTPCKDSEDKSLSRSEKTSKNADSVTHIEVIRQMLLNFLQDAASADDHAHLFTCWFYLLMWYKDDPDVQNKLVYSLARVKLKTIVRDSGLVSSLLTRQSIRKITLAIGRKSSFFRGFDKILYVLLVSLRENSPLLRAKALRAVSIIVEADPEVLCEKRVQLAVEGRFCDSAISVREAALELVGRHIASHPDVGLKYFEKISERVKDTGVSVRKRAIRIIRDMCTSNADFSESTTACLEIMSRVSDDEATIQDLVCKTFYEFWFEEHSGVLTQYFSDESSVPLEVAKKTEQIVDTLRRMPNHQLLVSIIQRNLALDFFPQSAKASGINPVSLASVHKRCESICKCLLERMLQVEESSGAEVEKQTLPYVMALHAFCTVDPTLCAPASDPSLFVITLQPYLKSNVDNRIVAQQLESIIFVIDAILPLLRKLPQTVIEELEQDLKHMIVRHSFLTVVHACIKCLCSVSKVAGKGASVIEYLIQVFFKRLAALAIDNKQNLQQVGRSIFCLGLLIRYGTSLLHHSSDEKNLDVLSSLDLFKKHLYMEDFVVRIRSLQALGFVLIAKPEYMLERDIGNILEAALSPKSDYRIKMQALQNILEYLLDAENQMGSERVIEKNVVDNSGSGGHGVPSSAGAGDNNICGGIIQLYWDKILATALDTNMQVRRSALKIVEAVLRQGLVHPITCVPCLIALVSDPHDVNSRLAYQLLTSMNEKHPSFLESRLGDGLQTSFVFMQFVSGSSDPDTKKAKDGNKEEDESLFSGKVGASRIYRLIRGNRVSRNKFMSSVVRKFDSPTWRGSVIPFLTYCTEILAFLPFTSPDEPLYLIYAINRIIQVRAAPLEANMKAWSINVVKGESKNEHSENGDTKHELLDLNNSIMPVDANGTNQQDPTIEPIPDPATPANSSVHSADFHDLCEISKEDLQKTQADCLAAIALQLLLKLKRHLKMMYGLNDERCQAFSPNEPLKPGESLSKQSILFDIKDTRNSLPKNYQEFIQLYQGLKQALKEDTIDYSAYTTTVKRKRPQSKRNIKVSRMKLENEDDDDNGDGNDDDDWETMGEGASGISTRPTRSRNPR